MKKMIIMLCFTCLGIISCKQKAEQTETVNPFFSEYNTPFQVPPFEQIKLGHYIPAFEKGMLEHKKEVDAIINSKEEATFDNTIAAIDKAGELLGKVSMVFYSIVGANTNKELDSIQMVIAPVLAAHGDDIRLNPKYFERIKAVYDNREQFNLTAEQLFILENQYKGLVRNGAELTSEKKEELKAINQKLSTLAVQFDQNVLSETNSFKLVIDNEADLAGLPESVRAAGADDAKAAEMEGKWVFTTQRPSMYPFLQYSEKRDLREKLYMAYTNRSNHDDDKDNKAIVAQIMKLRVERANLLGYKTHAHLTLEPRMAGTPDRAIALLDQLWNAALPIAKSEAKQMQAVIDKEGGNFKLASWDWWYYAEKIRMAKYNLDENEVRPYFKLENVRDGAFWVANQLYGITFTPIENIPLPHPDAQAFEVKEADGSHLSVLYMDFYPRESKSGGAWCGSYRDHHFLDGKEIKPIVTVVCNLTKPAGDTPSLLSMDDVSTLFHEFGHALDGMFAKTTYNSNYIAWDFVELPSQIMEHWVTEPEVLKQYAKHYQTGDVIPNELVKKMDAASKFNQGFVNVEIIAASLLDLAYHTIEKPVDIDVAKFEKDYLNSIGLIPEIESRYRTTYFGHIIGGYDAGYYSYTWAAVLDNDAYEAFTENGIFDKATADKFRKCILEKNGIENAMEMYVNFRGREPKIEPLLKNRGLN
ncbi:MAG: M3 family metallopeptidase [Bacteroidetes bacterium]|nr:M3 family metallopeptidase [Bacteroidota bacterium]